MRTKCPQIPELVPVQRIRPRLTFKPDSTLLPAFPDQKPDIMVQIKDFAVEQVGALAPPHLTDIYAS